METKKITEGGMLSALQIVLGLILIPTGIGYVFYVEIVLPITVVLIYLRCGKKVGLWTGVNTFLVMGLCYGNIALAVYMFQALGFGILTALCIDKDRSLQDDLLIECLLGCIFMIVLDFFTAQLLGQSLLDDDVSEMILEIMPGASQSVIQVYYYLSIAAMPVAFVMSTYMGSLVLGHRLDILKGPIRQKYDFIRHYKLLVPYAYHHPKSVRYAILGLFINLGLWPYVKHPYLKAWIASSGAILLYFILLDLVKLIGQALIERCKKPLLVRLYQIGILGGLIKRFQWTCCLIILVGSVVDLKTDIRWRQTKSLLLYMKQLKKIHIQ